MTYPTTDEVKQAVLTTDVSWYVDTVKLWKKNYYTNKWSKSDRFYKLTALEILVHAVTCQSINNTVKTKIGVEYTFTPSENLVTIGVNPSIISTLHEIGHAIWGPAEIDACRFSVALFQQVFPKEFSKLSWQGHMLIRNNNVNY